MSVHVTSWVWAQPITNPEAKLVLLKLADQANDDGICWPSRRTIARDTGISISTVGRRIQELSQRGFIRVEHRQRNDGGRTSSIYHFPHFATTYPQGHADPPPGPADLGGVQGDLPPRSAVTQHEPSVEPVSEAVRFRSLQEELELKAENARLLAEARKQIGL